jgi:hypothetical protein
MWMFKLGTLKNSQQSIVLVVQLVTMSVTIVMVVMVDVVLAARMMVDVDPKSIATLKFAIEYLV